MAQNLSHTSLYDTHVSLNAKMVPFAGWEMPVQYGSILAESRAVRSASGIFDVSHMGRLYISGPQSTAFMDWIVTAHASNLSQSRARYAMICNENGGIIDDTVFYRLDEREFLLVCNASNRRHVLPWMERWVREKFQDTVIDDRTETTAMIAFQGPATPGMLDRLCDATPSGMRLFSAMHGNVVSRGALIGRTGYTGEDGFELIVSAQDAPDVWKALMDAGAVPCGLGARDVLRLEAGLALHGNDIDASTTPLEAGLDRFVSLGKEFAGVQALRRQAEDGPNRRLVGLEVEGRNIARAGYDIYDGGTQVGTVTSGTHSPTLDMGIAMGYVLVGSASPGRRMQIDIRGRSASAEVVSLPFYSRNVAR